MATLTFHGAAQTVTGSRHLLEYDRKQVLIDCGLFQGNRESRERNWLPFPFQPSSLDAVVITHGHTDHVGLLPKLVHEGYRGPIYATPATIGLCRLTLPDSARLQEEEARRANKHGTRHKPAKPLYTEEQAYAALKQMVPVKFGVWTDLPGRAVFRYHTAGHILGSAMAEITLENGDRLLMGGDLGRYDAPILKDPAKIERAEYLVLESTYGDRLHSDENVLDRLELVLLRAVQTGGAVLVPSFAIGRTQELLYALRQLQEAGRMPRVPVYIDSPMAVSATHLYQQATDEFDEEMQATIDMGRSGLEPIGVSLVRDREASKALNRQQGPFMVISGSGMANGGRILHHLLHRLGDPSTQVVFTGFQGEGTLGRRLLEGEDQVRIFHQDVPVKAQIERLTSLSAHADQAEILRWLDGFEVAPRKTFLVHGEPGAQEALREKIIATCGWDVSIPTMGESFEL